MQKYLIICLLIYIVKIFECQIAPPKIDEIQRIRLNAYRVKWSVANELSYKLIKSRILLFDGMQSIEWPSQAVRVNKDGDDALELGSETVSNYSQCVSLCLDIPQCKYIVKSGNRCYLKSSTPSTGPCAPFDECAVVLAYSNEANLYELPMNTTFRVQVQVYDSKSEKWSSPSQLSNSFNTNFIMPKIIEPIEQTNSNNIRLKWNIVEQPIVKPIRYKITVFRKSSNDIFEWPAQISQSNIDGNSNEYERYSAGGISALDCTNACLRNPNCLLAVKDNRFCYLKDFPEKQTPCASTNGCWILKGYQSYADLSNIPFDEIYKFQVTIYDQYSQTWSLPSEYSQEINTKLNLIIMAEKIDEYRYKIYFKQDKMMYPIVRMRFLVSKNGSAYTYDIKTEANIKRFGSTRVEYFFNDYEYTNLGNLDESKCLQECYDDFKCVGVKIRGRNCYLTSSFDPSKAEPCYLDDKCYSFINTANETVIEGLDVSTNYKLRVEYYTKYNTKGNSNTVEFTTMDFYVNISNIKPLQQYESGTLKCQTSDDSLVTQIVWFKDGQIINEKNNFGISFDDTTKTLMINNLTQYLHNGEYKCTVQLSINNQIMNSTVYNLYVKYGPIYTDIYANSSRIQLNIGNGTKFQCQVEGYGPFKFGWKYNNDNTRVLDANTIFSNKTFIYFSELNLKNVTRKDNGSYSCFVDSTIISTIYVSVPSQPSKPRITNLMFINSTSVYINFQLDDNGDSSIERILIEAQNSNGNTELFEREIKLNNNFNGTIFDLQLPNDAIVRIRLKNSLGYGIYSEPVKYTIPIAQNQQGGLTQTQLIIAIVVPIAVAFLIAIVIIICYRKRYGKTTKL